MAAYRSSLAARAAFKSAIPLKCALFAAAARLLTAAVNRACNVLVISVLATVLSCLTGCSRDCAICAGVALEVDSPGGFEPL